MCAAALPADVELAYGKDDGAASVLSPASTAATGDPIACGDSSYSNGKEAFLGGGSGGNSRGFPGSFEVESSVAGGEQTASWRLFSAVLLCCCSPLLFGFAMGFTSPVQISMEGRPKGGDVVAFPPSHLSVFSSRQFTMYAAIINVGGVFGAFAGSIAMDRVGRKNALALSACPHLVAWAGHILTSNPGLLTLLRLVAGFGVGMGTAIAPVYIGEVSTARLRGPLGVAIQLSMNVGRLFVNAAGAYALAVDRVDGECFCNWRRLSLFGVAFAVALASMVCMPESPKWLARRGCLPEAKRALRALRDGDAAAEEAELQAVAEMSWSGSTDLGRGCSVSESFSSAAGGRRSVHLADYKRSLVVAVGLTCFQQLSGINAIMMYAMDICMQAGMASAEFSCILVMVVQVVLGALPCLLVRRIGRRPLLQFAAITMGVSHLGLAYYMAARSHGWWGPPWMALASLGMYVLGFSVGMGPVPWIVLPELFPVEVVGPASAIATGVGWSFAFAVCVEYRALQASLGSSGVFALFAACCGACLVFVTTLMPETKDRTLEQILDDLHASARRVELTFPPQREEEPPKAMCSA